MLHDGAGGTIKIFHNVERSGNILQIGLGKSVLSVFESLHIHDGSGETLGTIERRGLMGIGAVAQIVGFDVGPAADFDGLRKVSGVLGKVGVSRQFRCHFLLFSCLIFPGNLRFRIEFTLLMQ